MSGAVAVKFPIMSQINMQGWDNNGQGIPSIGVGDDCFEKHKRITKNWEVFLSEKIFEMQLDLIIFY